MRSLILLLLLTLLRTVTCSADLVDSVINKKAHLAIKDYYLGVLTKKIGIRDDDYGLQKEIQILLKKYPFKKFPTMDRHFFLCKWYTIFQHNPVLATEHMKAMAQFAFFKGQPKKRALFLTHYRRFLSGSRNHQIESILMLNSQFQDPLLKIIQFIEQQQNPEKEKKRASRMKVAQSKSKKRILVNELKELKSKKIWLERSLEEIKNPGHHNRLSLGALHRVTFRRKISATAEKIAEIEQKLLLIKQSR